MALVASGTAALPFALASPTWTNGGFSVSVQTQNGKSYALEYTSALENSNWTSLTPVQGNGDVVTLSDMSATGTQRFYRVRQQ